MNTKELNMHLFLTGWEYENFRWKKDKERVYDRTRYAAEDRDAYKHKYAYTNFNLPNYHIVEFDTAKEMMKFLEHNFQTVEELIEFLADESNR